MSLPTLTFRTVTLCTDARCTATRTCWRAEHEDFGNTAGEKYGPRCIPAPAFDLAAERLTALLEVERENTALRAEVERLRGDRAAVVAWLRSEDYPCCRQCNGQLANAIERGEHHREEEK